MSRMNRSSLGLTGMGLVGAMACSDGTGPTGSQQITFSVATAAASAPQAAAPDSVRVGGHTLVYEKVEFVLKEIELKRLEGSTPCSDDGLTSSNSSGSDDDGCEEFAVGPVLLDLPLTGTPQRMVTIDADTGTFRQVEFKVHKPEDGAGDSAFLRANPEFNKVSIRVRGRYDGQAFVYLTDLSAEQEYRLVPPLVVASRAATNLTLTVDLASWFTVAGQLVNPLQGLKGQPYESAVNENIKRSFHVFEDRNHDGRDDD